MKWYQRFFFFKCCYPSEDSTQNVQMTQNPIHSTSNIITSNNSKRKKDRIPKKVRDAVWLKYHGDALKGVCYCCGKEIERYNAGWHCSHILSDVKGGAETVENMRTCCPHCNLSMGSQNLYVYMKTHNMQGPGKENIEKYLKQHPEEKNSVNNRPHLKNKGKEKNSKII